MYWAAITRGGETTSERYIASAGSKTIKSVIKNRFSKGQSAPSIDSTGVDSSLELTAEKDGLGEKGVTPAPKRTLDKVSDGERKNTSRAVRIAGWSNVFYLITTDVLGPFNTP